MKQVKQTKSYAEMKQQLDEIVSSMQSGELDIDETITAHAKATQILADLEAYLETAKNTIQKITVDTNVSSRG